MKKSSKVKVSSGDIQISKTRCCDKVNLCQLMFFFSLLRPEPNQTKSSDLFESDGTEYFDLKNSFFTEELRSLDLECAKEIARLGFRIR